MTLPEDWALPALTPYNAAWFTSGALVIQRCASCATLQHPPEEICHVCGSMAFDDGRTVAPTGTVYSYTVAHYAANKALADSLPYTVVLVSLDEVPEIRVVGNLVDDRVGGASVHIGMSVVAEWDEHTAEDGARILLPQWRPTT